MSIQTRRIQFTYEDYLLFPEDGRRHELIDGDHFMTPAPSTRHQKIVGNLARFLGDHVALTKAGEVFVSPTDVVLSDLDVVQPDLLFVCAARASIITEKNIQGPPDFVIEIISETSRKTDETIKRKLYERYGVREYWIVDPELETVDVHRLGERGCVRAAELSLEAGHAVETPLLPGLKLKLSDIFPKQ
ncbi:MAG: Uma2 family endonuclease [Elusimicrobia bacterium]|nr:Uma2 family endonuclease [Elusimicrobiota bacterium]